MNCKLLTRCVKRPTSLKYPGLTSGPIALGLAICLLCSALLCICICTSNGTRHTMHADANSNSFFAQGGYNYPSACSSHRPATKTLLGFTVYIRLRTPHLFCNFASCRRHRKSRVNQLIMHLCIADLIVTFVMLPLEIGWHATVGWKAGNIACKVFTFFRSVNSLLSTQLLHAIRSPEEASRR